MSVSTNRNTQPAPTIYQVASKKDIVLKGIWELDLNSNKLSWSENQYKIYGYKANEILLNDEFFLLKTTHASDVERIKKIINRALKEHDSYNFKRRIIKKNGKIGVAETRAKIIRSENGEPKKIKGITIDLSSDNDIGCFDPLEFKPLFENYRKAIHAEIFKLTRLEVESKDLCQEVFIKAWKNIYQYNPKKGELFTWLVTIARNHCKDYFRSKTFRNSHIETTSIDLNFYDLFRTESFNLDRMDLYSLLSRLDVDQKELIELLFLKGYTQPEVAEIKDLPLGTVKTKSRMALRTLKELAYKDLMPLIENTIH